MNNEGEKKALENSQGKRQERVEKTQRKGIPHNLLENRRANPPERRKPSPYVELEGPVELQEGQNFYDQPPFNIIFPKVAERYDLDTADIQHAMTQYARVISRQMPDQQKEIQTYYLENKHLRIAKDKLARYFHVNLKKPKEITGAAAMDAVAALSIFPEWTKYVDSRLNRAQYWDNGENHPHTNKPDAPFLKSPSYAAWLEGRKSVHARIQRAALLTVLAETFPQDLQQKSIGETLPSQGERPVRKRWRILKASGLTRPR